jgi:hypothetical protein
MPRWHFIETEAAASRRKRSLEALIPPPDCAPKAVYPLFKRADPPQQPQFGEGGRGFRRRR